MTWTYTLPGGEGFYWARGSGLIGTTIIEVYAHDRKGLCAYHLPKVIGEGWGLPSPAKITGEFFKTVEWSGPIPPQA